MIMRGRGGLLRESLVWVTLTGSQMLCTDSRPGTSARLSIQHGYAITIIAHVDGKISFRDELGAWESRTHALSYKTRAATDNATTSVDGLYRDGILNRLRRMGLFPPPWGD